MARTNRIVVDLEEWSEEVLKWVEKGIETTTELAYDESRRRIPVDSGETRKSIVMEYGGLQGSVFVGSAIAVFLEFGTGIHASPKGSGSRAKKIPWTYYKDGQFFTTYGMVAQPFWQPTMDITEQYFKNYFRG